MREVGPDLVLHFAAQVTGSRDRSLVYQMAQNNVVASINLLDAATKEECDRIVLAGSLEEPNTSSEAALSPYAATKLAVTNFARMYHRVYATPVTVARIAMVYGPGCGQDRLIPYTITELMEDRSPSISSGDRSVDWVFIDDVVEGTLVTATTDQSVGKTIDIGTGTRHSIEEVVRKLTDMISPDSATPVFGARKPRSLETEFVADAKRTESLIGWKSSVHLGDGLSKTVEWYRAHRTRDRQS